MKTIWLLVLMTAMIAISCEAATGPRYATKGIRRGHGKKPPARHSLRQRMKTTTELPKEEKEEEPEEENPEEWKKKDGGDLDETSYDLAKEFFIDFDDDNIYEEPDEDVIDNEPEEVDFFASFPENEEELKTEDMLYIPEKKVTKGTTERKAYDEKQAIQKLFKTSKVTINCPNESPSNMYFTYSDHSWGAQLMLAPLGILGDYGNLEAKFVLNGFNDVTIKLNTSIHGWDPDCLQDLESTNTASRFAIGGVAVCARMHGFLKEMDLGLVYMKTRSVACIEVLTGKSQFGIILCVDTPTNYDRPPPLKVLCCLESVKYTNSKGKIDTVPDVTQKQFINQKCGREHGADIERMLFDVIV